MLKKFDNDASARFCWSDKNSREVEKKTKKKNTATRPITRLTESNLSVNNYMCGPVYSKIYYISARCRDQTNITYRAEFFIVRWKGRLCYCYHLSNNNRGFDLLLWIIYTYFPNSNEYECFGNYGWCEVKWIGYFNVCLITLILCKPNREREHTSLW